VSGVSDTAAAQLHRVLTLIPLLADDKAHSLESVASKAETTVAQLMSDIASISERFHEPAGFVDGVTILVEARTVSVRASHFHRPMRLTMSELCALELGLMLLRRTRTPVEQKPIDRALERLRNTVSKVPANDRHEGTRYADLANAASVAHLEKLRAAVHAHRKVRLTYRGSSATASTVREVSPHSLAFVEQMWYLVSTNEGGELRLFRVDRIESVQVLSESFARNAELASQLSTAGRAFHSTTDQRMTVRYSPRIARWLSEREGKALDADGGLTLEHPLADESWAIRHVLQYGPDAEILSPARLRQQIVAKLASV
jgi:predicted DNA-binding transcriptional regulator YafY